MSNDVKQTGIIDEYCFISYISTNQMLHTKYPPWLLHNQNNLYYFQGFLNNPKNPSNGKESILIINQTGKITIHTHTFRITPNNLPMKYSVKKQPHLM